ncbi:glycosyltransferase [Desulfonatronum parangueonense]
MLPTPLNDINAQITRVLSLIQAGNHESALAAALMVTRSFPDLAQGHALCGHVLAEQGSFSEAVAYFDAAIERDPLDDTWLPKAVRTALAAGKDEQAVSWLKGVEKTYTRPPSPGVLTLAREMGLELVGGLGVAGGKVTGWVLLPNGQYPLLRTWGTDSVELRLTPVAHQKDKSIWRVHIPLRLSAPLTIHLLDPTGNHLPGSPLYGEPVTEVSKHYAQVLDQNGKKGASKKARRQSASQPEVTVIVPVYDDLAATRECLEALEDSKAVCATCFEILVVWDAGPDPALLDYLTGWAQAGKIKLIVNSWNMGFVNSVNQALRHAQGRDVVLLNADAMVCSDWLDRLRNRAYSVDDVGTVTPMTNYGELVSYPHPQSPGSIDTLDQVRLLDQACASVNTATQSQTPDLPVGVGFCMYIRGKLLREVGGMDSTQLHRGYGEEVELCLRGAVKGFRNCCAPDVFVGHLGGRSFGADKRRLALQNNKVLYGRYPDYRSDYLNFLRRDPLRPYRERISRHVLQKLDGPLWIVDKAHLGQPRLWSQERDFSASGRPWTLLVAEPRGKLIRLTLKIKNTNLPHADIHLSLPEESGLLRDMLCRLDPDRIYALGPGRGTLAVAEMLHGVHGETHLALTRLPGGLLKTWKRREPPDARVLSVFCEISCSHAGLGRWLQQACRVRIDSKAMLDDPPRLNIGALDATETPSLLVCGLHSPTGWSKLGVVARILQPKEISLWAAGLMAWVPAHLPAGVHPAPLALDDPDAIWHNAGMRNMLSLDDDPASYPQWRAWAEERGMTFYTYDTP